MAALPALPGVGMKCAPNGRGGADDKNERKILSDIPTEVANGFKGHAEFAPTPQRSCLCQLSITLFTELGRDPNHCTQALAAALAGGDQCGCAPVCLYDCVRHRAARTGSSFPRFAGRSGLLCHYGRLALIANPELKQLLQKHDPTPNSPIASGVIDWADLPDRLHFIIDLFRCYQENQNLFHPPFMSEQVLVLKDGRVPAGRF
jgi:hypothetical protein